MIDAPNYTQTPNTIYDLMPEMGEAELRVTLAICRETFGWHRSSKRLSLRNLQDATGLSKQGVLDGFAAGEARGTMGREAVDEDNLRRGFIYFLLVRIVDKDSDKDATLVKPVDRASQASRQGLVKPVDNYKERKKSVNKTAAERGLQPSASHTNPPLESDDLARTATAAPAAEPPGAEGPTATADTVAHRAAPKPTARSGASTQNEADQFEQAVDELIKLLGKLNHVLQETGDYGPSFRPFSGLPQLARAIAGRGEGEAELREAVNRCLSADSPAAALVTWMRTGVKAGGYPRRSTSRTPPTRYYEFVMPDGTFERRALA